MTRKTIQLLSRESLEKVHSESIKMLEDIGIRVESPACRSILEKAGAKKVGQSEVLRLPASMVNEAMDQITKKFQMVHPTGERFWAPGEKPRVGTRVKMPKILDYGDLDCRPPKQQDVINLCRITKALDKTAFSLAIRYPSSDVPTEIDVADTMGLAFSITGKLSKCNPSTVEEARILLDIAAEAVGSHNADENPGTWVEVNTTSPLVLGSREGSIMCHILERHIPIDIAPMPIAGATTPFTLAGTLAVGNAEALFLCTLANAIWPGAKIFHSVCGSILNMKTANLSMGAAEACLLSSGEMALAHYYGLPTYRCVGYSDSYYSDIQAGIEKTAHTLMATQSQADFIVMGGPLNCAAHSSYEQLVIDHDIWEMSERIANEIEVNNETLAFDTVEKVGHGGSYLENPHTYSWLRSGEHYYGGSFSHSGLSGEENMMLTNAHNRVNEILDQPFSFGAPPDSQRRIKQYIIDFAKLQKVDVPVWTEMIS